MHHDEAAIAGGLELATSIREQYIHMAHALLAGDGSHLDHYAQWVDRVDALATDLKIGATSSNRDQLELVRANSTEMDRLFRTQLLPSAADGTAPRVHLANEAVERLASEAAANADAVAVDAEARMARAHDEARRIATSGMLMGGACVLAVIGLAVGYTLRLRRAVLRPLGALTDAAKRYGRGDFDHRVGATGDNELGHLAFAFDQMAEELAVRERALVERERMAAIGRLAAGVAHEINNPIAIVRGYIKTMLPNARDREQLEELETIDEEVAACQRLTADLLAYAERPRLRQASIDMASWLQEGATRLSELPAVSGHALRVDAEDGSVRGDRERLRQVLANLLTNAGAASPDRAPIHIRGTRRDTSYRVEVVDAGPGVSPEDRDRVFEPFFTRRQAGSGLGLAVSRSVITAHGGEIGVTAAPSGGACFWFELPRSTS